jgi:SAM-dependent methyltransferase
MVCLGAKAPAWTGGSGLGYRDPASAALIGSCGGVFTKTQRFYDLVYSWKDYEAETERLHALIQSQKRAAGNLLLDVACGSGRHLELLRDRYVVEGLDLDPEMLAIARERLPGIELRQGDFRNFDLGRRFDVVTCLFSSIAYARDPAELGSAIGCMAAHLQPGGLLFVEPFIKPEQFVAGHLQMICAEEPELKVARIAGGRLHDGRAVFDFHYLVGQPSGIEHVVEPHELSLFEDADYIEAFRAAGLEVEHDAHGLMGRGLFWGLSPETG